MSGYKRCQAKNCIYSSRTIKDEDYVCSSNGKYYHSLCNKYRVKMGDCVARYLEKISPETPKVILGKAFREMIYTKKIDPDYILFTIDYCAETKKRLKSVFSLYYVLNKLEVKDAFEKTKSIQTKIDIGNVEVAPETKITYHPKERKGWDKIIKN